jgi:serine/threonine protein phosphatase PrpC
MGFICAVADGVSAGGDARMAAQTSAKTLVEDYFGAPPTWDTSLALDRIIVAQNRWLTAHNRRQRSAGRGSAIASLTALVLRGHGWVLAHVGDTRAYLLREGECRQLTQDHCLEQAHFPSQRTNPTRALGQDETIRVDHQQGELLRDDAFVLVSSGVYRKLAESRIAWLAAQGSAGLASNGLVAAALAAGSTDDASALVVRVHSVARSRLDDALRNSSQFAPPSRGDVGGTAGGRVVTVRIAEPGVHQVHPMRDSATGSPRP